MEEYKEIENNAFGASGATKAAWHEQEVVSQSLQIAYQLEIELEKNQSVNS